MELGWGLACRWAQYLALISLSVYFASRVWKSLHPAAGLLCGWAMISAVLVFQDPNYSLGWELVNAFGVADQSKIYVEVWQYRMNVVAARAFAAVSLISFFMISVPREYLKSILHGVHILALMDCVFLLIFGHGFFNNTAMDSTFVAMVYPTMILPPEYTKMDAKKYMFSTICVFLPLISMRESTAFFVLAATFGSYFFMKKRWNLLGLSIFGTLALGQVLNKSNFIDDSGRFARWWKFLQFWYDHSNQFVGTGSGTFEWIAPMLGAMWKEPMGNWYIWMHNEYLQILFEQGIVGLVFTVILIYYVMKRARSSAWLFATNVGVLVSFLTQFPIRYFITQLFIALLIRISIRENERECLYR